MALISSVIKLQKTIENQIESGDLNSALRLIHNLVDQVFCEPLNTAHIFGSRLLDQYCQEIGAINMQRVRACGLVNHATLGAGTTVVYLVSRLYPSGGHTAVLADIIRLGPAQRTIVLITGTVGATDHAALSHRFEGCANVSFEHAPRGTRLEKLDWIQRKLLKLSPDTVWLLNHCQDSVAVASVQHDAGYSLRFYHHGDHQLCLGVYLDYADHIDPHPMGFHNCRDNLGIKNNRYLPLVVRDQGVGQCGPSYAGETGLITCTAAPPGKIEAPYFIHYADVIPELLRVTGGRHVHIGQLNPLTITRIRRGIRRLGLPMTSFVYIPYVRSVWLALHEYRVNLYIASFPHGGARTLIEVLGAGVAVAVHLHSHSRLLSTFDMTFEGALLWRNPQELYNHLRAVDYETLNQLGKIGREKYLEFFHESVLANALVNWQYPMEAPPLLDGYVQDELQRALDITNQISVLGVLRRILNRAIRRWKSSRA